MEGSWSKLVQLGQGREAHTQRNCCGSKTTRVCNKLKLKGKWKMRKSKQFRYHVKHYVS